MGFGPVRDKGGTGSYPRMKVAQVVVMADPDANSALNPKPQNP